MSSIRSLVSFLAVLAGLRWLSGRANDTHARFSWSFIDQLGTKASMIAYALIDGVSTGTQLKATLAALTALVEAATGAQVTDSSVAIDVPITGDTATAGSRVEQTALLDYIVTASGRQYGVAVPALLDTLVGAGGAPDLTEDNELDALADALTGALTGGAVGVMTSNDYLALGALDHAALSFRKRRKQLSRSSSEVPVT